MSFFSNEPTKELDQDDYEDEGEINSCYVKSILPWPKLLDINLTLFLEDYDQEDGRQNYLQNEEVYYNSDDQSENEYEMSQNTPILSPEGSQSRRYDDEYAAVGDVENCCEYLFCIISTLKNDSHNNVR